MSAVPHSPAVFVGRTREFDAFAANSDLLRLFVVCGVGGVGKTSFSLRAAEALIARIRGRLVYHACRTGESITTVIRSALAQLDSSAADEGDPLEALLHAAQTTPVVLVLDDAHRSDDEFLFDTIAHLASRRLPLWLCVNSREALPISPATVDHLVIHLKGLSAADSNDLLRCLERLYGPPQDPTGIERRIDTCGGNPLRLKQLFSSLPSPLLTDELGLSNLGAIEADILAILCAFRRPVPAAAFDGLCDAADFRRGLEYLTRRFLVEPAQGLLSVHDMVRDAVARSPIGPEARHHLHCAGFYRRQPPSEEQLMEILFHSLGAGDDQTAESILTEHASHFRRIFPVNDLVEQDLSAGLERLKERRRPSLRLRLLGARIKGRRGSLPAAYEELSRFARQGLADPLLDLDLGEMAYGLARLDEAIERLRRSVQTVELGEGARIYALALLAESLRSRGRFEEADAALDANPELIAAAGAIGINMRDLLHAVRAHDGERYGEAAAALERLRRSGPNVAVPGMSLAESLARTSLVALGRPAEEDLEPIGEAGETLFMRLSARLLRTERALTRGEARTALALAESASQLAARSSFRSLVYWAEWLRAEATRLTGSTAGFDERLAAMAAESRASGDLRSSLRIDRARCRIALAEGRLDEAARLAAAARGSAHSAPGTLAHLRAVAALAAAASGEASPRRPAIAPKAAEEAEGVDAAEAGLCQLELLLWRGRFARAVKAACALTASAERSGFGFVACRARLLGAEASLGQGDLDSARRDCAAAAELAERQGYVGERLQAGLLSAALARAGGDLERSAAALRACLELATACHRRLEAEAAHLALSSGASAGTDGAPAVRLLRRFTLDEPLTAHIQTRDDHRWLTASQLSGWRATGLRLIVDVRRRRVFADSKWIDLAARPTLFALVDSLTATPGLPITVEELVRRAWNLDYHPLRHHSRVTMAMSRLRALLGEDLLSAGKEGYALDWKRPWAVVRGLGE